MLCGKGNNRGGQLPVIQVWPTLGFMPLHWNWVLLCMFITYCETSCMPLPNKELATTGKLKRYWLLINMFFFINHVKLHTFSYVDSLSYMALISCSECWLSFWLQSYKRLLSPDPCDSSCPAYDPDHRWGSLTPAFSPPPTKRRLPWAEHGLFHEGPACLFVWPSALLKAWSPHPETEAQFVRETKLF